MGKVDCEGYTLLIKGSELTEDFCSECPRHMCCDGILDEADLKRLILENRGKLVKVLEPTDDCDEDLEMDWED